MRVSTRAHEILQKVRQLCGDSDKDIIGWLYGSLNVLDSKAAALLRFNGLFIALLAAFLTLWAETPAFAGLHEAYVFAAGLILLFLLVSSLACFSIIQVSWSFLGNVDIRRDGGAPAGYDFAAEQERLAEMVRLRTQRYWVAVQLSIAAILGVCLCLVAAGTGL